jgi:hypothetical protein
MKFVYVFCGEVGGLYSRMTLLSIVTLKKSNKNAFVILATDKSTYNHLINSKNTLIKNVDQLLVVKCEFNNLSYVSRYIKTRIGFEIKDPFVFIDSDTVVRKIINFELIDNSTISVVRNHNRVKYFEQCWKDDDEVIQKMNWTVSSENYFNTGVIFYSGNTDSVKFSELWHKYWLESFNRTGKHQDQPSFNYIINKYNISVSVLPDSYNAQIKSRFYFFDDIIAPRSGDRIDWDAFIWHYLMSQNESIYYTEFENYVKNINTADKINERQIIKLVTTKHPWIRKNIFDDFVGLSITTMPRIKKYQKEWLEGNRSFKNLFNIIKSTNWSQLI